MIDNIKEDLHQILSGLAKDKITPNYSVSCWQPTGYRLVFVKRGVYLIYFDSDNIQEIFFRSGRIAKKYVKRYPVDSKIFSDVFLQPIIPIDYITLNFILTK
jgi:hypothetical protein